MKDHILSREKRKWVYGIIVAGLLVAAGYGIITQEHVELWLLLASAVLGLSGAGLASANLPPKDDATRH